MDLSKAFGLIPHDLLLAELSACGITTHSLNLLTEELFNKSQATGSRRGRYKWCLIC